MRARRPGDDPPVDPVRRRGLHPDPDHARIPRGGSRPVNLLEGAGRVLTFGRSLELETALVGAAREKCRLAGLVVGEGRPDQSGRDLATAVAAAGGINIRVVTDSATPQYLGEVDLVMIGTDAVRAEGVVARTGTLAITAAALAAGTPVYLLAGGMKLLPASASFPDPRVMAEPGPSGTPRPRRGRGEPRLQDHPAEAVAGRGDGERDAAPLRAGAEGPEHAGPALVQLGNEYSFLVPSIRPT